MDEAGRDFVGVQPLDFGGYALLGIGDTFKHLNSPLDRKSEF